MFALSPSTSATTLPCSVCVVNWSAGVKLSLKLRCVNLESCVTSSSSADLPAIKELGDADVTRPAVTPFWNPLWLPCTVMAFGALVLEIPVILSASANSTSIFFCMLVTAWLILPYKESLIGLFCWAVSNWTVGWDWELKSIIVVLSSEDPSVSPALALPDCTLILPVPWFDHA